MPKPLRSNGVGSIRGANGAIIDLKGTPLRYGKDTAPLGYAEEKAIVEFEAKVQNAKKEHVLIVAADGTILEETKGTAQSASVSESALIKADALTHNHPRNGDEKGMLGGTFSLADTDNMVNYDNLHTIRAIAPEGVYSMTKGARWDPLGFESYYHAKHFEAQLDYNGKAAAINGAYKRGELSRKEYIKKAHKAGNEYMVRLHNILLAGASTYGYTYGLEKRRTNG